MTYISYEEIEGVLGELFLIHYFVQYLILVIVVIVGPVDMCITAMNTLYAGLVDEVTHICMHLACARRHFVEEAVDELADKS